MATKFITVSIEIMHDNNLTPNQKFILAEIQQLSSLEKGCIASNRHFSELIGITTMGVSKAINDLADKGYITIDNAQTKRNFGRVITINSGKSDINSGKSDINSGLESKENKTINKTKNISIDIVSSFFDENRDIKKDDKSIKIMSDFVTYRKKIKKPIKTTANLKLYYNKLKELHIDGFDIDKCIEEMKTREWQMIDKEYLKNRKDLKVSNSKVISNTSNDSVLV